MKKKILLSVLGLVSIFGGLNFLERSLQDPAKPYRPPREASIHVTKFGGDATIYDVDWNNTADGIVLPGGRLYSYAKEHQDYFITWNGFRDAGEMNNYLRAEATLALNNAVGFNGAIEAEESFRRAKAKEVEK
ncbi:MAG: hypothetical protein V1788_03140 [Nanoarchaeota archaeon]